MENTISPLDLQEMANAAIYIKANLESLSKELKGDNLARCKDAMNMSKWLETELYSQLHEMGYRKLADGRWYVQKRR